ncbi:uncharacterized protein Dana_GF11472 [Drosophila ananassae]|uniref:C2H2-type domain-containing protein n=1 Tax=Drosophila ananassae TaxID=7217 RepID=B3MCS7_DROAN|nr:zinc finger protein 64 [Drosophila ananassae]EDV37329.1 uncharacterized protein Dana_GF11472 [Drosophila ananassae]
MGGYVESGRVYLNPDGASTLLIKCCLCSTSTFSGNQFEDFLRHLSIHHSGARKINDDEIQDEVQVELANLKESGMAEALGASYSDDEQEEFTNVEYLIEEDEFNASEQEFDQLEHENKHVSIAICEDCDRRFPTEQQMQLHKFRFHGGPNPNTCLICQKGFPNASRLRQHKERYHLKTLKWQCHLCDYNAPSKWDFQQHHIMHSGLRNYICDLCGQSCKTSSALAVHRRKHELPKLDCTYCKRKFRENYTLRNHMRNIHQREPF